MVPTTPVDLGFIRALGDKFVDANCNEFNPVGFNRCRNRTKALVHISVPKAAGFLHVRCFIMSSPTMVPLILTCTLFLQLAAH